MWGLSGGRDVAVTSVEVAGGNVALEVATPVAATAFTVAGRQVRSAARWGRRGWRPGWRWRWGRLSAVSAVVIATRDVTFLVALAVSSTAWAVIGWVT